MFKASKKIQVFEYQYLHVGKTYHGVSFTTTHFNALVKLNELHSNCYFNVGHKKIQCLQYVGVVQIDDVTIEILPKIDSGTQETETWQNVLIDMLKVTKRLKVRNTGQAYVKKQSIHLLDIYFDWFLNEVQLLVHQGLVKQYYKETNNVKALKGKLEFAGHISRNTIHKERFYTTHQVYDKDHKIHQILQKALHIIANCTKGTHLYSKCKTVLLDFPEVKALNVSESTFDKLNLNRKTQAYETALEIARLIILNYAPNIKSGAENMLALLFDMNILWEEYVLICLKKAAKLNSIIVKGQSSKSFWNRMTIRPDIVVSYNEENYIIDTKWKNIKNNKPSINDLRQMYVYNDYWNATKALLLYPSEITAAPRFIKFDDDIHHSPIDHCALGKINILEGKKLNKAIGDDILKWFIMQQQDIIHNKTF